MAEKILIDSENEEYADLKERTSDISLTTDGKTRVSGTIQANKIISDNGITLTNGVCTAYSGYFSAKMYTFRVDADRFVNKSILTNGGKLLFCEKSTNDLTDPAIERVLTDKNCILCDTEDPEQEYRLSITNGELVITSLPKAASNEE